MSKYNREKLVQTINFVNSDVIGPNGNAIVVKDEMTDEQIADMLRDAIKAYPADVSCPHCGEKMPEPEGYSCLYCAKNVKQEPEIAKEVKAEEKQEVTPPPPPVIKEEVVEESEEETQASSDSGNEAPKKKRGRKKKTETVETVDVKEEKPAVEDRPKTATVSEDKEKQLEQESNVVNIEKKSKPISDGVIVEKSNMQEFLLKTNANITISAKSLYDYFNE